MLPLFCMFPQDERKLLRTEEEEEDDDKEWNYDGYIYTHYIVVVYRSVDVCEEEEIGRRGRRGRRRRRQEKRRRKIISSL